MVKILKFLDRVLLVAVLYFGLATIGDKPLDAYLVFMPFVCFILFSLLWSFIHLKREELEEIEEYK